MNPNDESLKLSDEEIIERELTSGRYTFAIILFYSILGMIALAVSFFNSLAGIIVFCGIILHVAVSLDNVGANQVGGILFAGRYLRDVRSGITFVLSGLCFLSKDRADTIEDEHPAPARLLHRVKEGEPENIEKGKFAPVRITFADSKETSSKDALDKRMTAEVSFITRYRINDYRKFLKVVVTIAAAKKSLEDAGFAVLLEEFSRVSLADAQERVAEYNTKLMETLNEWTKGWGITLEMAKILPFGNSRELNKSLLKVPEAMLEAEARKINAEADKIERTRKGEGDGAGEKALLTGRTDGLEDMSKRLKVSGHTVLAAKTALGITENPGQKTIIAGSGGFGDIAIAGTVLGEALKGDDSKSTILLPKEAKK